MTSATWHALLDLEELDRDLFRGRNGDHGDPRPSLYGGQVAAQALMAAGPHRRPGPAAALAPRLLPAAGAARPPGDLLGRPRP